MKMNKIFSCFLENEITRDIIDCLINGGNVLILKSSEDYEYNFEIFNYLSDFIFYDFKNDNLFEKINKKIESRAKVNQIKLEKIELLQREILSKKDFALNVFNDFSNVSTMGYSLNELYNITKKNIEFKDKEFEFYDILNNYSVISNNKYNEIIDNVNNLIKDNYIELFVRFKKFKSNKRFDIIKEVINNDDIDMVLNKLSSVVNNTFAFIPPIYFNKYSNDFIKKNIYYNKYDEEELKKIVKEINYEHNGELLNDIKEVHWFNPVSLFNYTKIQNINNSINEEYYKYEKNIYNQYIENIDNLTLYSNSFKFVKKVFKDVVLNEINNRILSEDELYNYILYIRDTLSIYKEYLNVKKRIDSLTPLQKEIMNHLYENINDKKELKSLLAFIDDYYKYKWIEELENEKSVTIHSYENLNKVLDDLFIASKYYFELVLEVLNDKTALNTIKYISENEGLKNSKIDESNYSIGLILKAFPLVVLNEEKAKEYFGDYNEVFKLVIMQNELYDYKLKNENICIVPSLEKLDNIISRMISNLGFRVRSEENNSSILYVDNLDKEKNEVIIYINSKSGFENVDLIKLIELREREKEVRFVWHRNWWINKNLEICQIQEILN